MGRSPPAGSMPKTVLLNDGNVQCMSCQISFEADIKSFYEHVRRHTHGPVATRVCERPLRMCGEFRALHPIAGSSQPAYAVPLKAKMRQASKNAYSCTGMAGEEAQAVVCTDGETVSSHRALQSQLVQNMPCAADAGVSVNVPFTKLEVEAWESFSDGSKSFWECAAAYKVADFLQDEHTSTAAATRGCALLKAQAFPKIFSLRKENCWSTDRRRPLSAYRGEGLTYMQRCTKVSDEHASILYSLGPHMAEGMLRTAGIISRAAGLWLHVLPHTCHAAAVAAAIDGPSSSLSLNSDQDLVYGADCSNHIASLAAALTSPDVSSRVKSLHACMLTRGEWLAEVLTPLNQLQSLQIVDCRCVTALPLLPALERLHIAYAARRQDEPVKWMGRSDVDLKACFTLSIGNLTGLKELEFDARFCNSIKSFALQLKKLTVLTHLSLSCSGVSDAGAKAIGRALPSCPSLASLSLSKHGCTQHGGESQSITVALPQLPNLTKLHFSEFWMLPNDLSSTLSQLQKLQVLDMTEMGDFDSMITDNQLFSAIGNLQQLQHFNAWHLATCRDTFHGGPSACPYRTADLLSVLPTTLTLLDLQPAQNDALQSGFGQNVMNDAAMRCLGALPNLAALCLSSCKLPVPDLHHFSTLTALKQLVLGHCHVPAEGTATLLDVLPTCMTGLDLQDNELNELAARALGALTGLRMLALGPTTQGYRVLHPDTPTGFAVAQHLRGLTELRTLRLNFTSRAQLAELGVLGDDQISSHSFSDGAAEAVRDSVAMLPHVHAEHVFPCWRRGRLTLYNRTKF